VETLVRLSRAWSDVAGPIVAAKALPDRIRGKVLTVRVENHAWAQELSLRKPILLAKLAALLGEGVVTELRFEASPLPAADAGEGSRKRRRPSLPPPPRLPDPEGLSGLADPELKRILRSIQAKSAALRSVLPDPDDAPPTPPPGEGDGPGGSR
jgi:hypothetical protein